MWWYAEGWWWWWLAFLLILFVLPLGYGWGYRGWGPWYRRRRIERTEDNLSSDPGGWGWLAVVLWIVLMFSIVWLIAAWGAGAYWVV